MGRTRTLAGELARRGLETPDLLAFRYLVDGEAQAEELTFGDLLRRVRTLAVALCAVAQPGGRALILLPQGLDAVVALYACLMAGVVAVPVASPHPSRIRAQAGGLARIAADCQPSAILAPQGLCDLKGEFAAVAWQLATPDWIAVESAGEPAADPVLEPEPGDIALLQYTSGSTGMPRGVVLTHAAIMANQAVIAEVTAGSGQTALMSWLPFYHDLGLSFLFQAVYLGQSCTLMSPAHFMLQPMRWMRALARFHCSGTAGPNFALDRVLAHVRDEDLTGLDLSHVRMLCVGAEPVKARTLRAFTARFAPCGFDPAALYPCYGLAETTLMAAHGRHGTPVARSFQPGFSIGDPVRPTADGVTLVGNGGPGDGHRLVLVDPESRRRAAEGCVGEIWISGPSVGRGYWGRPEESRDVFSAELDPPDGSEYLRTGDLGFERDGELYITGRQKDLVIVRGRNIYPDDVEEAARAAHPALAASGVAAFGVDGAESEGLAVVAELTDRRAHDLDAILAALRESVGTQFEAEVLVAVLVSPLSLPRTTSGKIQRRRTREALARGDLAARAQWRHRAIRFGVEARTLDPQALA